MNTLYTYARPKDIKEYLHRIVTYEKYKANVDQYDYREVESDSPNYIKQAEIDPDYKTIVRPNSSIDTSKILKIEDRRVILLLWEYSDIDELINKQIEVNSIPGKPVTWVIPIFLENQYRYIGSKLNPNGNTIQYHKATDIYDLVGKAKYCNQIMCGNQELLEQTITIFNILTGSTIDPEFTNEGTTTLAKLDIGKVMENKELPEPIRISSSRILQFLVPSFGKKCGIGDYHWIEKQDIIRVSSDKPIIITHKRIQEITKYSETLLIHHEYLLYSDPTLSENTWQELERYVGGDNPFKRIIIMFHTVPEPGQIGNDRKYNSIRHLINSPKVYAQAYNEVSANNLRKYYKGEERVIESELGLYPMELFGAQRDPGNLPVDTIGLFGFNHRSKGWEALIDYLLANTDYNILMIGSGTDKLVKDTARVRAISEYLPYEKVIEVFQKQCSVGIAYREPENTVSTSASYRFIMSLGIPVIASDHMAHRGILTYLNNKGVKVDNTKLLFEKLEEIPDMLIEYNRYHTEEREEYFMMIEEAIKVGSIGRVFIDRTLPYILE